MGKEEYRVLGQVLRSISYICFLILIFLGTVALWYEEYLSAIVSFLLAHLAHDLSE